MKAAWPEVMMDVAKAVATRSKDATTQVGAVVAGPGWDILGTGLNGFSRGAPDDSLPTAGKGRHLWTVHAEVNALLRAVMSRGQWLEGCRLFSTHRPCAGCLLMIAHCGIRDVAYGWDQLDDAQAAAAAEVEKTLSVTVLHFVLAPWGRE